MRTQSILVPTNLSPVTDSVLSLAEELAHKENSAFSMLHAYEADRAGKVAGYRDFAVKRMRNLVQLHHMEEWPHRCFLRQGSMERCVKKLTREQPISLVVLGKEWGEQKQADIISRSACPVLVVPEGTLENELNHITFATEDAWKEKDLIMEALHFASLFNASFTLLHVKDHERTHEVEEVPAASSFLLDHDRIRNEYVRGEDLVDGVQEYLANHKTDIVAVAGVSGGWLVNHKSKHYMKKLLAYPGLPLLFINHYNKN